MTDRRIVAAVVAVVSAVVIVSAAGPALAAQRAGVATHATNGFSAPKTPWGDPDLQGVWTNFDETPFERPNPDKAAAAAERAAAAGRYGGKEDPDEGSARSEYWNAFSSPKTPKRPSMVVDPPDGRVPVKPGAWFYRNYTILEDTYLSHTPSERCIARGVPGGMFPGSYNNGMQIVQSPGYVVILSEMLHETRIIPTDGRPHLADSTRLWNGDSRGRWDGQTLVVETINFNGSGIVRATGGLAIRQTPTLRVVERLTLTDTNTIAYTVTVEDPQTFFRPWTAAMPLNRDSNYRIYEVACHEGNRRYMEGVLRGGREREKGAGKDK